jgi:hypothetical protein
MTKFFILFLLSNEFRRHLSFIFRIKLYLSIFSKNYDYRTTNGEYSGIQLNENMYHQGENETRVDNFIDENINDLTSGLNYTSSFSRRLTKKSYEFKILNTNKKFCIRV